MVELQILDEGGHYETGIGFDWDEDRPQSNILVISDARGRNIEFVGGNQTFPWWKIEGASRDRDKNFAIVGPVSEITYFSDKHHLGYPKREADGNEYYHKFGKDPSGDIPWLVYDTLNNHMMLIGGDYEIRNEGITG